MILENISISLLSKYHKYSNFHCGIEKLDHYIQHLASQDIKRYLAKVYVASLENDPTVLGFYTLSACRIDVGELPAELSKKLPHYPYVPALLIGRLAISQEFHNKGLGKLLLMDALFKSLHDSAGGMAVIVNAKTIHAKAFYKKYGFVEFPDQHNKLFLHMAYIKKIFI